MTDHKKLSPLENRTLCPFAEQVTHLVKLYRCNNPRYCEMKHNMGGPNSYCRQERDGKRESELNEMWGD